jgi:hypothetical protein
MPVMILVILGGFDVGMEMLVEPQLTFATKPCAGNFAIEGGA